MIPFNKKFLTAFIVIISGCSSLDSFRQSYKNLLPSSNESYVVQPGDSLWSIAIKYNLDSDLLIKNNNLKKPYIIYPNQELLISKAHAKSNFQEKSQSIKWHHPLGEKSNLAFKEDSWLIFKESKGVPIHSINHGKVVVSGPDIPGYGNLVMISHSDGYLSLYAHCDKIFVEQGDEVIKGAMIAQLGNSEAAYPMLRFQLRKNGQPLRAEALNSFFN